MLILFMFRNIFQLHNVHGGQQCGHHHHDIKLSPQTCRHARDAGMGES